MKEALNALYHHPDNTLRMQADRWLQDFQRTLDAWQVLLSIFFALLLRFEGFWIRLVGRICVFFIDFLLQDEFGWCFYCFVD